MCKILRIKLRSNSSDHLTGNSRVAIGDGLTYNDSRFIPVHAIKPYVQLGGRSDVLLELGGREVLRVTSLRV